MLTTLKGWFPQPLVAGLLLSLALLGLGGAWLASRPATISVEHALLALALVLGLLATYQFPIHLGFRQKVEMSTVPLYLAAVLLPAPALAATVAGVGVLAAELMVRGRRGNYISDVVSSAGRWAIVVLAGACVAHLPLGDHAQQLVGAALVLFVGELITYPLLISPLTGDRPFHVIRASFQDASPIELAQYLLGLLGALAANYQLWGVLLLTLPTALVYQAFKSAKEMQTGTRQMLENMADTVDLRDPYTGGHSRRVAEHTARILRQMSVTGPEADLIEAAARIHDIGKIGIPDGILNKAGPLTPDELAIMQTHPERGADLLVRYPDFVRGVEIVRHHHESWDGTGYPHRLKGTAIPFGARVIAVADSFDAMTSDRPYRTAMPVEKAASILRRGRGQQWDAQVVDAFLHSITDQLPEAPVLHLVRPVPADTVSAVS
jgi:hypothetical protein